MSGDVQPRKRKDKKRKKDELGIEEPRGTAAALGEGDVFMHSYHDHGTGGHWCAKIIFFSLLAVLLTLIGLIILENRGLSELEANAVESRYSGVLEGWLEDAPDDDHHDAHTLDLKHHDDDDDDHDAPDLDHDDDDEGHDENHEDEDDEGHEEEDDEGHEDEEDEEAHEDDEDEDHDDEEETGGDDDEEQAESQEQELEENDEGEDDREPYRYYSNDDEDEDDKDNDDDIEQDEQDELDEDNNELENEDDDNDDNQENDEDENNTQEDEEDEHDENEEEDEEIEVEKIEQEASDEEPISTDLPALPEDDDDDDKEVDNDDDDDDNKSQEDDVDDADNVVDGSDDADDDFLEADEPEIERISAPAGKPFVEVEEDDTSSEKPTDTLEEEEEYEKQQEELRKEEEESTSHIWLKLSVGGALLAATHALVRRAAGPRDEAEEEHNTREETPVVDRRMTLIPEEHVLPKKVAQESAKPKPFVEEVVKHVPEILKSTPIAKQEESEEEEEIEEPEVIEEEVEEIEEPKKESKHEKDKELYSDEEEVEDEEEEVPEPKTPAKPAPEPEADDDVPDDVEIIDEEELEDELEEEEEEVSDVDDTELLSRLEAKYGRLPEPERPGQKHKDGGNSLEDQWPGEPSDAFWRQELDSAEERLRQGAWTAALERASAAELRGSARARYVVAAALDRSAEAARDNRLLSRAITAYLELLKMNEHLSDKKLLEVAQRALNRIQFRGNYLSAEPIYRLLIRRFPNEPTYRNNLTISFLMANRVDLAEVVLKETIARWPNDRVALAHYGFVLKTSNNKLEEAIEAFKKALDGDEGPACEPRFYYHYGDALLLLGRYKEAHEVHKRGAKYGHFLSPAQRSLYNVPRLKSKPWWNAYETPYSKLAKALEKSWKEILKEGEAAKALYEKEKEGLKERGDWSQMDLFVRGQEIPGRCKRAPVTCSIVKAEVAAAGCRRGQVKFSAMEAGTHVRPHVGPTNCRLRMHLGLSNTKDTYLRVDQETRQWQEGRVLLFDDSFEHEVWHNGTGKRLVLIVDVWHPDLTAAERRSLPAI